MARIIVEFYQSPDTLRKARSERKAIVEAIEKAIAELKIFKEDEYSVYFTFEWG